MDSARWEKIQSLFHDAAELPAPQRRAFLESSCGEDQELLTEVLALLEEDSRGESLLERGVAGVAYQMVGDAVHASLRTEKFGHYRIKEVLGEGGMGVVYLAERDDLGNLVAIKLLPDAWVSPSRRERFASEQRMLAQLNHPSIARLYDANTLEDGTPWFVMEYVDGVPFTEYCRKNECSVRERLQLLRLVCEAVVYAHQHALIHRDLKPSNILVKRDGTIRLLDFGIAKQTEGLQVPKDQTKTEFRLLTPAYAAPEQMRGEPAGVQTDVYSLGVILYELLAGRLPFELSKLTPAQAERVVTEQEPAKPSVVAEKSVGDGAKRIAANKSEWADLDVLCLTAVHKDLRQRYPSVEAFVRDIDHFLKGEPLEARPDTLGYRARKFVSRHRRSVAAAAAVFFIIVGLAAFFTVRLKIERDNANRQTAIAASINQFLAGDLLGRGSPFQSGQASESLLDAIKQASPGIDRKFADEPQVAAELHLAIAKALDNRSNFPEATAEYERADKLFLQVQGPPSQDAIVTELQLAAMDARSFQGTNLPEAKKIVADQEVLLAQIKNPRKDLPVWLDTAKGMIALVESDAKGANQFFKQAYDEAAALPDFDDLAKYNLKQRLAFTYIRLGDGATAERLEHELIDSYSAITGPDSPYVLRVRLNLAQAYMIQRKFQDSINEATAIYPEFLAKFGPDHELTMQLLSTRAASEGNLGMYDDSLRDDLAIYKLAVEKQGPLSFYAIGTLADASTAQCRAGHLIEGEVNARKAYDSSVKAFGEKAVLSNAAALPLAQCLIDLQKLPEATKLLDGIDVKAVAQLTGNPDWGADVTLAQAEIAFREGNYDEATTDVQSVREVYLRPDAEAYQRQKMEELTAMLSRRARPK